MAREAVGGTGNADSNTCAECDVVLVNRSGLNVRAAMRLAELAAQYEAAVVVENNDQTADGRNMLDLLLLDAPQGTQLHIRATGRDAREVVDKLAALARDRFGEEQVDE